MKKHGFTLVELLAVIVILGILLIIAVPKINNVIDNAQKGAYKSTNSMIVSELRRRNGLEITPQVYTFTNGVMSPDIEITGELPKSGTIEINSLGQIQVATSNDKYCAIKRFDEDTVAVYDVGDRLCNVIQEITLTVNPNGGTYSESTSNTTYQILPEATQSISKPTRDGYVFNGWSLTCESCLVNNVYTMGEDEDTLTANWLAYADMFTYTGTSTVIDDGNGNWRIKFLTSGTLTFLVNIDVDVFLVGGGGGGARGTDYYGAGGAGGGYTSTYGGVSIVAQNPINVVVGAGGNGASTNTTAGAVGGMSYFINSSNYFANGGGGGKVYGGGTGGSGGGSGSSSNEVNGYPGLSNGASGTGSNGAGQGTTTREFGESTGTLYSGGGGGAGFRTYSGGAGGAGGGGAGSFYGGGNGTVNTGGGGGGSCSGGTAGKGGSGIVVIRNNKINEIGDTQKFKFIYNDGLYEIIDGNTDNWRIKFLTTGTFIPLSNITIDAFLVGGGGGGARGTDYYGAGGAGGGYTSTYLDIPVVAQNPLNVVIGAGGAGASTNTTVGATGGMTYFINSSNYFANGGGGGKIYGGGTGGSGGGSGSSSNEVNGSPGLSDGASGTGSNGAGQGTTTREFGELTGTLYAGGGGGAGFRTYSGGAGGAGGGGAGSFYGGGNGTTNTGGGGGGGCSGGIAGNGGSGIVVIRPS